MDPLAAHQRAQDAFARVLGNVSDEQLEAQTPCTEWKVRDVVNHVIAGNYHMAGEEPPEAGDLESLRETVEASARAAQDSFAAPDGLTRTIEVRFGSVPGSVIIGMRTSDVVTHAWDVARATGQATDIEPELATELLGVSRQRMRPEFRRPGGPFGEEQTCDPDRPPADHLAAFLGRSVG